MSLLRFHGILGLFLIAAIFTFGACRSETGDTPEGLIVVNAPVAGKVRRVLAQEGTNVPEKATLIEIEIVSNVSVSPGNVNRQPQQTVPDTQTNLKNAEDEMQRASIELQRIEPLVASGAAPQAHLDAARAQYQQAQERLDSLRRGSQSAPPSSAAPQINTPAINNSTKEIIVAVPAPSAGNVRVISVRSGQFVKAGQAVATISADQ